MEFKIGDKVKIREDLKYGMIVCSYERNSVVEGMLQYAGKTATITDIDDHVCYLDIDGEEWIWGKDVLEKLPDLPDLKPVDQVIDELESERTGIIENNKKIGQMINRNVLTIEQNELLAAQKRAYDTVSMILGVRIRSLKKQLPEPVKEPKKFNVQVPGLKNTFYYRDNENDDTLRIAGACANHDSDQQFTLEQIEEFKLQDCLRTEVTE